MSWSERIERLTTLAGIEPWYYDIMGVRHETTRESKVLVLGALGFDVSSIAKADAAVRAIEEQSWREVLPPFVVVRSQSPVIDLFLPASTARNIHKWQLRIEEGATTEGEFRPETLPLLGARKIDGARVEHRRLEIGSSVPIGYHRIIISSGRSGEATLAAVPEKSYLPPSLADNGRRLWGVAAHLYTLRSRNDWGIGDFKDLGQLCALTGQARGSAVVLNPFHVLFSDRPEDASPYSPSSRLFLNPIYIAVSGAPEPALAETLARLRAGDLVNYSEVWRAKSAALEESFADFRRRPAPPAFLDFVAEQGSALEQFALFAVLSETFGLPWDRWPVEARKPQEPGLRRFAAEHEERCQFHRYVQFLADEQLRNAAQEARKSGMDVGIVRDLAMGISPDGADAWMQQESYVAGLRCGAPPDDFQPKGQEWGVLPLNPLRLRRNLAPFAQLLRANMRHSGGLRIDHVIGFQRQFLVPLGAEPKIGCYLRFPLDDLLGVLALESHRNRCLIIGEDLGTIPEGFRERMHDADIFGCAVFYFERDGSGRFKRPRDYRRKAAASVGTHDLPTLPSYWEKGDVAMRKKLGIYDDAEAAEAAQQRDIERSRLIEALSEAGFSLPPEDARSPVMTPALRRAIHAFLASSSAQLFLVKLDDLLGEREQLNVPGTTTAVPNWRRKLPVDLDDPVLIEALNEAGRICAAEGRSPPPKPD